MFIRHYLVFHYLIISIVLFPGCRYDDVTKRLKESSDEFERAKEAAQVASKKFENIKSKRMEMFMECFNHVSDSLTTIYKDLTKSSKHPLGGNAYLSLDDSEVRYIHMDVVHVYIYRYI